ncbi:hypothetical protein CEXT_765161 [Caerostris extrusa]|uniref:Uncharacterized protein n=1 Tax=Caerostris extrusa TaxID=172846 RepID=A0AAV4M2Z8_CAEEX|nr:hypothetical protein CEXT_765161 [Caerostris extrusa]
MQDFFTSKAIAHLECLIEAVWPGLAVAPGNTDGHRQKGLMAAELKVTPVNSIAKKLGTDAPLSAHSLLPHELHLENHHSKVAYEYERTSRFTMLVTDL